MDVFMQEEMMKRGLWGDNPERLGMIEWNGM